MEQGGKVAGGISLRLCERFRVDKFADLFVLGAVQGSAIMADRSMCTASSLARMNLRCTSFPKLLNNGCAAIQLVYKTSNEESCSKGKAAQISSIKSSPLLVAVEDNLKCKYMKGSGSGSPDNG